MKVVNDFMPIIGYALLAYVIGSIPSGLIIGKLFFNTDVRLYGSKNIGATNTYRVIGLKAALPVFFCDKLCGIFCGFVPFYILDCHSISDGFRS